MSKKLSKYITSFDYTEKTLIPLSATSGGVSIIYFVGVIGAPVGIASAIFSLLFSLTTGIKKKLLSITRNKKRNIIMLVKCKLNSIKILLFQAPIDFEISHVEFKTIVNENKKYEKIKETIRMMKSSDELNENNKKLKKNSKSA